MCSQELDVSGFQKWLLVKEEDAMELDKENVRVSNENVMYGVLTSTSVPKQSQNASQLSSAQHVVRSVRLLRVALLPK
jgi:hypothetical protein